MNQPYPGNGWQHLPPPPYYGQPYPPGPHPPPPPPPKKRKTWPWILLALAAVVALAAGGLIAVKLYTNRDVTLTLEVTGTGSSALVAYSHGTDPPGDFVEVSLPWSSEGTGARDWLFDLIVQPTTASDTVTCRVTFDGMELAAETSTDGRTLTCTGLVPAHDDAQGS